MKALPKTTFHEKTPQRPPSIRRWSSKPAQMFIEVELVEGSVTIGWTDFLILSWIDFVVMVFS